MKKILTMLLLVFFLSIIYMYSLVIGNIPKEIVVFEGEEISMKTLLGMSIKDENLETIETSSSSSNKISNEVGKSSLEVSLFDNITDKETYATYHVYIVKTEDTIESIINKYNS